MSGPADAGGWHGPDCMTVDATLCPTCGQNMKHVRRVKVDDERLTALARRFESVGHKWCADKLRELVNKRVTP